MTCNDQRPAIGYQISVSGSVGPVLRQALRPCRAARPEFETVVRVTVRTGEDMADVVGRLESMGLEVTDVCVVP